MSDLTENLKAAWDARSANQKRMIAAGAVVAVVLLIVYMAATSKISQREALRKTVLQQQAGEKSLLFDGDTLERDLYDRLQAELQEKANQLEAAKKALEEGNTKTQQVLDRLEYLTQLQQQYNPNSARRSSDVEEKEEGDKEAKDKEVAAKIEIPPPPPPPIAQLRLPVRDTEADRLFAAGPGAKGAQSADVEEVIGSIGHVQTDEPVEPPSPDTKKNRVYLAPSFMEAVLLSGVDAPITGDAQNNPKPTLLRIAAPAVLPNRVRANLKGCFVIASGYGSLAEERINLRLIRLSCVARNGEAVIEEKVKGYVVDSDGKFGLHARVYMKAGQHLVRQFVAGVAEGVAEVVKSNSMTTSVSALGATQTIANGETVNAGLAGGVSSAAGGLSDFYKKLAEQTLPTLEVGPKKKVTLVLTEGVELNIRNYCEDCDANS